MTMTNSNYQRRDVLKAGLGLSAGMLGSGVMSAGQVWGKGKIPLGKAEHCIFIWLGGGMGQMDTIDPKKVGNQKTGNKNPGSLYPSIDTAVKGIRVCEHMPNIAKQMEDCVLFRSVHHDVIDEHAAAVNRMHTGRPTSGTIVYPSIGSIIGHEKGDGGEGVPRYVVVGYPNLARGPGFLGAKHTYLYLTDTEAGPAALKRAEGLSNARQARRERLLQAAREQYLTDARKDKLVQDYDSVAQQAEQLASDKFMRIFNLHEESKSLRQAYGGEFGQRCLLARRLVQRGVRFVEVAHNLNFVNGTGWDVHNEGIDNQHLLIRELDQAVGSLIVDLKKHKMLDKTLIVVSTEFGRPAGFDGRGGRGHHSKTFSVLFAGGGLQTGTAVGVTDDIAMKIVEEPVSVPDLFATQVATLGINPSRELHDGDRPVPITDRGVPVKRLF